MAFTIRKHTEEIWRIENDRGLLVGLITDISEKKLSEANDPDVKGRFKIELAMKIEEVVCGTRAEAFAFVRGAEAAMRAYKVIQMVKDETGK